MENNPLDGITFNNVPLEEELKHEKDEECSREFVSEVMKKKSLMAPIPCKYKYKTKKERNGMARELSQKEINAEYLGQNLKICKTQKEFVICLLLSGEKFTNKLMLGVFRREHSQLNHPNVNIPTSSTSIATLMRRLEPTRFGEYIETTKEFKESTSKMRRRVQVNVYQVNEEGRNLKPAQAFELAKKRIGVVKKAKKKLLTKIVPAKDISPKSLSAKDYISDNAIYETTYDPKDLRPPTITHNPPISLNLDTSKDIKNISIQITKTEEGNSQISITFD